MASRTNNHYHTRIPNPKTSLLYAGEELTYKELVAVLGEDFIPPTNSSRKKQLRDFEKLFSYTQGPGRKLIIQEIYSTEEVEARMKAEQDTKLEANKAKQKSKQKTKQKANLRKTEGDSSLTLQKDEADEADETDEVRPTLSIPLIPSAPPTLPEKILYPSRFIHARRSKYYLPFVNILLRYLAQRYGSSMHFLPTRLYECCGMTNMKYGMTNSTQEYLALNGEWRATANEVRWFYNRTLSKFRMVVEHQLSILEELEVLSFNDSFLLFTTDQGFFPATAKEVRQIREAEEYALDDFQMTSTYSAVLHHRSKEFYQEVMKLLPKQFRGEKYYKCYQIIVSDGALEKVSPMEEEEYCEWAKQMNDLVIAAFDESVDKYWQKYCEKVRTEAEAGKDIYYYSQRFVENEKQLAEELLRIE